MIEVERERVESVNRRLVPKAFEAAWTAFQNTGIDLLADADDEACKCVHNAIVAYLEATGLNLVSSEKEYPLPGHDETMRGLASLTIRHPVGSPPVTK